MSVSTHVLDSVAGRPAVGIAVRLLAGDDLLAEGVTDRNGRCRLTQSRIGHAVLSGNGPAGPGSADW